MAREKSGETIGLEEGMTWLPSQVLHEACHIKKANLKSFQHNRHHYRHHHRRLRFPAQELPLNNPKCSSRPPQYRAKSGHNWASGGPGMQAIFLESAGQKSCGTGVFLPQRAGTNTNTSTNKKPACAPVLLPSRVVQALNLNVHALGLQISPRQDPKSTRKGGDNSISSSVKNKKLGSRDGSASQCSIISQKRSSSPELFLPKEWTY